MLSEVNEIATKKLAQAIEQLDINAVGQALKDGANPNASAYQTNFEMPLLAFACTRYEMYSRKIGNKEDEKK